MSLNFKTTIYDLKNLKRYLGGGFRTGESISDYIETVDKCLEYFAKRTPSMKGKFQWTKKKV